MADVLIPGVGVVSIAEDTTVLLPGSGPSYFFVGAPAVIDSSNYDLATITEYQKNTLECNVFI